VKRPLGLSCGAKTKIDQPTNNIVRDHITGLASREKTFSSLELEVFSGQLDIADLAERKYCDAGHNLPVMEHWG
jgi:hypothetical protein